jgi:hypothetical protein
MPLLLYHILISVYSLGHRSSCPFDVVLLPSEPPVGVELWRKLAELAVAPFLLDSLPSIVLFHFGHCTLLYQRSLPLLLLSCTLRT